RVPRRGRARRTRCSVGSPGCRPILSLGTPVATQEREMSTPLAPPRRPAARGTWRIDMSDSPSRRRRLRPLVPAILLAVAMAPAAASAADCGGAIACRCGDTVRRAATLGADVGVCSGTGLRVLSGAVLDCAGHTITGSGLSPATYGVPVAGATGATVKNCRVTGFRKGIRLNGGSGNTIAGNEVFTNHDYGIEFAGGSTANLATANNVYNNRDEGIHVGAGANANEIRANTLTRNKHENVYVLSSDHCQ